MDEIKVLNDLYLFSSPFPIMSGFTFNQYLLTGPEPLLIHTGSVDLADNLLTRLEEHLAGRPLSYIFISHFESDECGALSRLLQKYSQAKPICSQVTARQIKGFGMVGDLVIKNAGETLNTDGFELQLVSYPSEMHLWEGLLAVETKRKVLFSSDLFIHRGVSESFIVDTNLENEIEKVTVEQIPSLSALDVSKKTFSNLSLNYIAPGHGPVLRIQ